MQKDTYLTSCLMSYVKHINTQTRYVNIYSVGQTVFIDVISLNSV